MWADAQFYENDYLLGRPPAIPLAEFLYWSRAAEALINWRRVTLADAPDYLKICICEVAEMLYHAGNAPKPGELVSESNASYSWKAQGGYEAGDLQGNIESAVRKHLAGTELHNEFVSRGV